MTSVCKPPTRGTAETRPSGRVPIGRLFAPSLTVGFLRSTALTVKQLVVERGHVREQPFFRITLNDKFAPTLTEVCAQGRILDQVSKCLRQTFASAARNRQAALVNVKPTIILTGNSS